MKHSGADEEGAMFLRFIAIKPILMGFARFKYRFRYSGVENVPPRGPFIIMCNHQTEFDGVGIAVAVRKTINRTMMVPWGKYELGTGEEGLLGRFFFNYLTMIPIDRDSADGGVGAIRLSQQYLKEGKILLIFPEGHRYPDGEVGPFQHGIANLARSVPVPIVPMAVWRRPGPDRGIQLNIGKPFFMPDARRSLQVLGEIQGTAENAIGRRVDALKRWSASVSRDRKGMKMIAKTIDVALANINPDGSTVPKFSRMAQAGDSKFLQDRILELLPHGWITVENRRKRSAAAAQSPGNHGEGTVVEAAHGTIKAGPCDAPDVFEQPSSGIPVDRGHGEDPTTNE